LDKPRNIVQEVVNGGADALIMTPGFARATWDIFAGKAGLILRVTGGKSKFNNENIMHTLTTSVKEACLLGADAVCNMIFLGDKDEQKMFEIMQVLGEQCYKYGLVLFTELLPGNFEKSFDHDWIDSCVRLGFEYGADVIKTYYTNENYEDIVNSCPVPVVMAGGPKDTNIYTMIENAINKGASGVAIGRNIFQSENPSKTVSEIVKFVHRKEY
jgi:class I fructose-bisphosphate aldolase/fructose-bisphosphate aldolase/2-amino-3,7-dideoxy-D-threo-hept-6-ulosonate synthase